MLRRVHPILGSTVMTLVLICLDRFPAQAQGVPPPQDEASSGATQAPSQSENTKAREQQLEDRINELEKEFETLSAQMEVESIERMIQDAQNEARAAQEEPKPEQREFLDGGLALQKLNPELTFSADIVHGLILNDSKFYAGESDRSGMPVRAVGLHFQHVLDPYSMFKSAFHISPHHGLHLEEVYVSWFGLIPSLSFTLGRFRQNFGVVNRWHEHDLDQTQHPLALALVLGEEGLIGDGLMVKALIPSLWAHANELTLEVVDGSNATLFAGEHYGIPSSMLHLKNYYDLTPSTYLELGLTGMLGFNNKRGLLTDEHELVDEPWRKTQVAGADLTLYWSPPQQARYRSIAWRTEYYYANKKLAPTEASNNQHSWGLYSYLQYQLSARWFMGVRGDVALPTVRDNEDLVWDTVPYVTFWQSEFVYLRLEYRHGQNIPCQTSEQALGRRTDNRVLLQIDFAAGPHKHEKY
ncbi:MAG: hypothetical protein ABIH26_01895 [Candidatus Eisenbacteria bacterium]